MKKIQRLKTIKACDILSANCPFSTVKKRIENTTTVTKGANTINLSILLIGNRNFESATNENEALCKYKNKQAIMINPKYNNKIPSFSPLS
ncbi:hypothetical protein [Lysinibacillus sp. RC46]|uniref:hypothetical protein n=1 Tax=unclassified Lysinibacillus TaxID=2636778 RepID=UPI003518B318